MMSTQTLHISTDLGRVRFEASAGGTVAQLELAGLIDVVAGHDPPQLSTLLAVLWDGSFKEEARGVLDAAVACRDPLSDLGTICQDSLRTLADLDMLIRARYWHSLISAVGHPDPRACALLNACDRAIEKRTEAKQTPYKALRARLEAAAERERTTRRREIEIFAGQCLVRCPEIWYLYERWRNTE